MFADRPLDGLPTVVAAARQLLSRGPRLVAFGAGESGDVFAWPEGTEVVPRLSRSAVDPTGGGDAMVASLALSLLYDVAPAEAARRAAAAAALTVRRLGGRPDLTPGAVEELARRHPCT